MDQASKQSGFNGARISGTTCMSTKFIDSAFLVATSFLASLTNQILFLQQQSLPACRVTGHDQCRRTKIVWLVRYSMSKSALVPPYKTLDYVVHVHIDKCAAPLAGTQCLFETWSL